MKDSFLLQAPVKNHRGFFLWYSRVENCLHVAAVLTADFIKRVADLA